MKLSRIIAIITFISVTASISRAQEGKPHSRALSGSFREKLSNLESFQAIYSLNRKDTKLFVTITVNRKLNYIVASMEKVPTPSFQEFFMVLDYQPENKSFTSYAYVSDKAIRYDVFPDGLTSSLNNPLGVLAFLSEQVNSEVSRSTTETKSASITSAPTIGFGLSKDKFKLQLGCQFDTEKLSASWTDVSMLTNALTIEEHSNAVVFNFPNGHSISVSSETGLLIEDNFPNSENPEGRYIQFHSIQEFDDDLTFKELIPKFTQLHFEKIPATTFEQAFTLSFLESLGKQLALDDNFDRTLEEDKQKLQEAILPLIRKLIHQNVVDNMDPLFTENSRDEIVMPFYQKHLKNHPNTSFNEFLDLMKSEITKNPTALFPTEAQEFIDALKTQKEQLINQLSDTSREPISKLMDISLPVYFDALMLEYYEQLMNGM